MPNKDSMHVYQKHAVEHVLQNPFSSLFLGMGLGKTLICLTSLDTLLFDTMESRKVLVIAPLRVALNVWDAEIAKWEHLRHLRISKILGDLKARVAGFNAKADIYIINRENVTWLVGWLQGAWPFDTVVIDELSSFKSHSAQRFRSLKMVRPRMKRLIGLTGTPAPNGILDLWSQVYLMDMGERLGKNITTFREQYFTQDPWSPHTYKLREGDGEALAKDFYAKKVYDKIGDICISMKEEDYLELPKRTDTEFWVDLSPAMKKKYDDFEREQVLELADQEITAMNAMGLSNKLRQFASGAVYDSEHAWHHVHDEKLDALAEWVEAANGQPVLIFYEFKHEQERILKRFKVMKPNGLKTEKDVDAWNRGAIDMALVHPASAGHGLNLQYGGHLCAWFDLTWSLELYQQGVKRVDRQGQTRPVLNTRFLVRGTMDEDVLARLDGKAEGQEALLNAVKARIDKYLK